MEQIDKYTKVDSKIKYFVFLVIRFFLLPLARMFYGSKKIWIICERGDDAQDNGFVFFKYLVCNNKNVKPIFLINKQSDDYIKVKTLGKVVQFGSFKHFLMCIGSRVKISSNLYGYAPWIAMEKFYRRNKSKDLHVFLQHGIIKNYHESFLAKYNKSLSLFITGAYPEYEYISANFGYRDDVVYYSGLPRFDNLLNSETKPGQVLIMPTWRSYLKGLSIEDFKKSHFYKKWNALLENQSLLNICNKDNIHIEFYLHHELQKFLCCFSNTKNLHVVKYDESTVQKLLIESKVLITDYSSVFFDFAYLHKPILFYQFDEEEYYSNHYEKGYFDYRESNLGDVFVEADSLIKQLGVIVESKYNVSELRKESIDKFYIYRDSKNCERIYNKICEKLSNK